MGLLTVYNCTFEGGNSNWSHIYTYLGNLIVENSTFTNSNSRYSNAIYSEMTTANIRKSKFNNLTVTETGGTIGMKNDCRFKIVDCEFTNLTAGKDGGAIFADLFDEDHGVFTSNLTITNSIFKNCKSEFGAVMQLSGNLNITDSTFEDNTATFDGAAIWTSYANVCIQNSTFKRNNNVMVDLEVGGVLYLDNGNVMIKDSKFIDNHGSNIGDAIYTYDVNLILSNNTFTDNGNALYSVFGTNNISEDNVFNNDTISLNNTFYSTIIVNEGIEIKLINNTISFDKLPSKFNLKDWGWLSPIKDQGAMGACWTFGSCGALESALLKATGILYDFSEDSVQNTMLQYSIYGLDMLDEGGDSFTGAGYFINWYGPYPTQLDTYDELGKVSQHLNIANEIIHIQDVIFLPPRENALDNDIFKNALIKYGSLFMCYNAQTDAPYYNVKTSAQYYNESDDVDHAVSLVGWDDNFSKDNFLITPPGDGAWIVKNSWGTSFGDEGYFYLSYYDNSFIGQEPSLAFLINNTEKYTKNYQTDTGELCGFNENYTYYSNTYTSLSDDLIAAVGTYFSDEGTEYELSIYVNDVLKHTQKGVSPFSGFHTIKLTENISVSANDKFKVVFKSSNVPYMIYSRQHWQDNVSFVSTDGSNWVDMKTLNATAILKVYTVNAPVIPPEPTPSKPVLSGNKDVTMLYSAGTAYKVRVTVDGKAVSGVYVTFKFNGVTKKVKTDSNGYATYKIPTVKPKSTKYTISATYGGVTVKNKVKVKSIVVAKNIKAKKSAKVLKIKVTLKKVNKKYIKGKYVTLKFKGKTYKVKTSKKGVATFKIKKNVLKKLKVGKKYTYKVTYGKDVVSKKITIKK
ncbi:MAG: right-handed parallel beta-helix repeat-containing protein [Methanobrevibacter sp.]|uniref:C1 family peptidase n=1 Tax=Methanobrevibacter sp. TaxID=66852 RepID=UPI0025E5B76D|nr:C1 family peptidase [Methanobrevibacter sp.]MBQ8017861.1 right-handed parallel beta-helix repeat-containing protein [Methanobrevibacter sp.]